MVINILILWLRLIKWALWAKTDILWPIRLIHFWLVISRIINSVRWVSFWTWEYLDLFLIKRRFFLSYSIVFFSTQVPWQGTGGNEKFFFENENVCTYYMSWGSWVQIGQSIQKRVSWTFDWFLSVVLCWNRCTLKCQFENIISASWANKLQLLCIDIHFNLIFQVSALSSAASSWAPLNGKRCYFSVLYKTKT